MEGDEKYPPLVRRYREHLYTLVEQHQIRVLESKDKQVKRHYAAALPEARAILLPEVDDETGYAVALHEIGHLVAPGGCDRLTDLDVGRSNLMAAYDLLTMEHIAWAWARATAVDWTVAMEQTCQINLGTYVRNVERLKKTCL